MATTLISVLPPVLALTAQVLSVSQAAPSLVTWVFLALFVFLGMATGGQEITFSVLAIEVSPVEDRIIYMGFTNTLIGVLIFLTPVGGLLADLISFEALFGAALTAALAATVLARGRAAQIRSAATGLVRGDGGIGSGRRVVGTAIVCLRSECSLRAMRHGGVGVLPQIKAMGHGFLYNAQGAIRKTQRRAR